MKKNIFMALVIASSFATHADVADSYLGIKPRDTVEAFYGFEPSTTTNPESDATTSIDNYTFDINNFLGAYRYYNNSTPITGQNTITFNLEAGHIWNGHESLAHVSTFVNSTDTWGDGAVAPLYDRHATWVGMLIGGRKTDTNSNNFYQQGMASGTDLRSAAISTGWNDNTNGVYSGSFNFSYKSYTTAYISAFGTADVVNSSYGYTDTGGSAGLTILSDAMSHQNPTTLHVVSAGNSGPSSNTVGAPGAGYNTMTVAALGDANNYDSVAYFSSRGPQDFAYDTEAGSVTVQGVRAAVDIAAPGQSIVSAYYGGQTGGNDATLDNSVDGGTATDLYSIGIQGTSFSSPIVAGGAALVSSAAKTLPALASNTEATQSLVVKSLLMTGADKTDGWDNGQQTVTEGENTFVKTSQSLDWETGAGRMNLDSTFDIQVNGQQGVDGLNEGSLGTVAAKGWDYGQAQLGTSNEYIIGDPLQGNTDFTTTLAWGASHFWRSLDSIRRMPVL